MVGGREGCRGREAGRVRGREQVGQMEREIYIHKW